MTVKKINNLVIYNPKKYHSQIFIIMNPFLYYFRNSSLFVLFLCFAQTATAQIRTEFRPLIESDIAAKMSELRAQNINPDDVLYTCYTISAVPHGGENPKKAHETVYQTGLQKQADAINAAYRKIDGAVNCKFNFQDAQVSFWVKRSATKQREVITELCRLLDGLAFDYNVLSVSTWQ